MSHRIKSPTQQTGGIALSTITGQVERLRAVRRDHVRVGDRLVVKTLNSQHVLQLLGEDEYLVSGSWFERSGLGPTPVRITGCTWGGSMIKIDIVAACGLCIEFSNKVTTSVVQKVFVLPRSMNN
jgi:hypothetical protein